MNGYDRGRLEDVGLEPPRETFRGILVADARGLVEVLRGLRRRWRQALVGAVYGALLFFLLAAVGYWLHALVAPSLAL